MKQVYHNEYRWPPKGACLYVRLRYEADDWYPSRDRWVIDVISNYHLNRSDWLERYELSRYATTNEALEAMRLVAEAIKREGYRVYTKLVRGKPEDRQKAHLKEQYGAA